MRGVESFHNFMRGVISQLHAWQLVTVGDSQLFTAWNFEEHTQLSNKAYCTTPSRKSYNPCIGSRLHELWSGAFETRSHHRDPL